MVNDRNKWWSERDSERALAARAQAADDARARMDVVSNALRMASADLDLDGILDAARIAEMDMAEYARLRERAGLPDLFIEVDGYEPSQVRSSAPGVPQADAGPAEGVDFRQMSMQEYAAVRAQLGIGAGRKEGRGILDGGSTKDWIAAAQAHSGRTAMVNRGVEEAARPDSSKYLTRNDRPLDTRSAHDRFSNASTFWNN